MKINWAHIIEGWRNHLIPPQEIREKIKQVSEERMAICRKCEYNSINVPAHTWLNDLYEHCTNCGCPLQAKTKCLSEGCELKRWDAVMTFEQAEILNIDNE